MKSENKMLIDKVTTMIGLYCDILNRVTTLRNVFGIVIEGIDTDEIEKMLDQLWKYSSDIYEVNLGYLKEEDVIKIDYHAIHAKLVEYIQILVSTLNYDNEKQMKM